MIIILSKRCYVRSPNRLWEVFDFSSDADVVVCEHELDSDSFGGISSEYVNTIVIVISPLNSLMSNQISRLSLSGIRAAVLFVKVGSDVSEENIQIDFSLRMRNGLRNGYYHIVFAHPESLISSKYGRDLLLSKTYKENVVAIVVDEAHCILDWLVPL